MPQFAVLFSLLTLAAMGLPPFGVFAGFMGLLFASSFTSSAALVVIVIAWLAASWYILETVQRLLFGRQRSDLRYEDLRRSEFASLLIVVLIVIALGVWRRPTCSEWSLNRRAREPSWNPSHGIDRSFDRY